MDLELIATFCQVMSCPQLFIDRGAEPSRAVIIRDDFNSEIRMSRQQFNDMCKQIGDTSV